MKTTFKLTLMAAFSLLCASSFAQSTDDSSGDAKTMKKHLKIVKIEDGVKTELDTVITGDDSEFFRHGGPMGEFDWQGEMPPMPNDSMMMKHMQHFRFEGRPDGKGPHREMHVFRMPGNRGEIHDFEFTEGDSIHHMMLIHDGENGPDRMFMDCPEAPMPPQAPMQMNFRHNLKADDTNVIRLDSPDIISYKKKTLKDGTEKIEIVRKQPKKKRIEVKAEVNMENDLKR